MTSWATVPDASGFFVGLTGCVPAQIDLANLTSRNPIGHLLVRVVRAGDPVNVHHNALVDLERTDCRATVASGIVAPTGFHGNQSRD
jgi:hypothetical protein